MKVSESWLREWVSVDTDLVKLAEQLTMAGLEVEAINQAGPVLDDDCIVVCQVLDIVPHPQARQLHVCTVDIAKAETLEVVCGAPNLRTGMKTVCAVPGAQLPAITVSLREIRGVQSRGMLCSESELGLGDDASGIMELDEDAPNGCSVHKYLDLGESIIDLVLTPNRGDCLSVAGVAREVSMLGNIDLNRPAVQMVSAQIDDSLQIALSAPQDCPRYVGRVVRNIDMHAKTPDWMSERLKRGGMRPINPVVDITNYVMHELGQPMHAFDLARIRGGINVRRAYCGEQLVLLDGSLAELDERNLVIADDENAIGLAGIMGGGGSAISGSTCDIYLEAAFFSPDNLLGRARELGMNTEASHRFERGVDYQLQQEAMERATALILDVCGGRPGPVGHAVEPSCLPQREPILFNHSEISRIMGIPVPLQRATRILEDLGMGVKGCPEGWQVIPPSWRFDIEGQHDLVEEIGRCVGFDQVPPRMPHAAQGLGMHPENEISPAGIRSTMVTLGYHEAITYSFVDPELQKVVLQDESAIPLQNPIADNMSVMRQSLWPGLLEALVTNLNRQEERVRLFEVGQVFRMHEKVQGFRENHHMAALITGKRLPRQWGFSGSDVDFFDMKGDLERVLSLTGDKEKFSFLESSHPALQSGQCAEIHQAGKACGMIGKLNRGVLKFLDVDQDVYLFEVMLEAVTQSVLPAFSMFSRFPSVHRDLAVVVDECVTVDEVFTVVRASAGGLLRDLVLFDIYQGKNLGENAKSLGFSLTFQSESSNLLSIEVDKLMHIIIKALGTRLNAQLRSGSD